MKRDLRLKRLNIRAKRRGSRELDIIFSRFIDSSLNDLNDGLLLQLEEFLEMSESDLQSFFLGNSLPPKKYEPIFNKIYSTIL